MLLLKFKRINIQHYNLNTRLAFIKESFKNIKTTGTIMPSSRFLIKKMLRDIDFDSVQLIVEYGAGNGIITKQILNKMNVNTTLICFEINDEFYKHLQQINDQRLIVLKQSAAAISSILKAYNLSSVDYFISSLPLAIMPLDLSKNILNQSKLVLKNGGLFVQYQYSTNFLKNFKQIFGKNKVHLNFEILNLPPAFIYKCIK